MYPAKLKLIKGIKTAVLILVLILFAIIDSSALKLNISGSLTFCLCMLFCAENNTPESLVVALFGAFLLSLFSGAPLSLYMLNFLLCTSFLHFLNERILLKNIKNIVLCVFLVSLACSVLFIAEEFFAIGKISLFYLKSIPLKCLSNGVLALLLYPALIFLREDKYE